MPLELAVRQTGIETSVAAVTSEMPWPLDSGGHLRSYHLLKALAVRFDVRLIAPQSRAASSEALTALRAAGLRPCAVEVAPRRLPGELVRAANAAIRREPYVMFGRHRHRAVQRSLKAAMGYRPPDVIYLDHLDSLVYADLGRPTPIVVDMHNVYSRLVARAAAEADDAFRRRYLSHQSRLLERMERRAAEVAHTVLAVSFDEAGYFRDLGARRVIVVPNGVDCGAFESTPMSRRNGPPTILYVGSLAWPPNANAATFLARDVFPAVRQRVPEARLVIVGKDPPPAVLALARSDHVKVAANVPDVTPYYGEAHVLAVPLQAGGGTRLKILEAFAAGLPVVSTAIGCEGLDVVNGCQLIVAERSDFVTAITSLLTEPDRGQALAERGRALALAQYDWRIVGRLATDAVGRAAGELQHGNRVKGCSTTERTLAV
jgi:glycosyltransferase involved in cell wall biosynthesis